MPDRVNNTVLMKDVELIFRNFEGKETEYNRKGDRNFGVIIPDPAIGEQMIADGWNIKLLKQREDDDPEEPQRQWLPVAINWKGRPPRVAIITSRGRTNLDEASVEMLDWADIKKVDLIVNPYNWEVNGNSGVKAYVKTLFVTIEEDELEREYAELEEQGLNALPVGPEDEGGFN